MVLELTGPLLATVEGSTAFLYPHVLGKPSTKPYPEGSLLSGRMKRDCTQEYHTHRHGELVQGELSTGRPGSGWRQGEAGAQMERPPK